MSREIVVTKHAIEQYRDRYGDERSAADLRDEIRSEIGAAFSACRDKEHKDGRLVWDADARRAWIVVPRGANELRVVTTLPRAGLQVERLAKGAT